VRKKIKIIINVLLISFFIGFLLYHGVGIIWQNWRSDDQPSFVWEVDREPEFNPNRIPSDLEGLEINRTYYGIENGELGVGGFSGESDNMEIPFRLQTPQDRLNARINNHTPDYWSVILKVFYNYEEVDFRIQGADVYDTEFLFEVRPGYTYEIPFHLDPLIEAGDTFSKLTMVVIFEPDEYAMFNVAPEMSFMALNFEINYGSDNPPEIEKVAHEIIKKPTWTVGSGGFGLTTSGNLTYEDTGHPGRPLKALPGERIELDFAANMSGVFTNMIADTYIPTTDYLIIGLLDFNQVPLSGRPFLWAPIDENVTHFGSFYFNAPMEPGLYDFTALIVPNPTMQMSWDSFLPLEMSTRFTIEVLEQ